MIYTLQQVTSKDFQLFHILDQDDAKSISPSVLEYFKKKDTTVCFVCIILSESHGLLLEFCKFLRQGRFNGQQKT